MAYQGCSSVQVRSLACGHNSQIVISYRPSWVPGSLGSRDVGSSFFQRKQLRRATIVAAKTSNDPHLQLATAKIPSNVKVEDFASRLYQWASTLTSSGRNMPFALPLKTDRLENGFELSLLRVMGGKLESVGDLVATVEPEPNVGNVLFVRFFEGPASGIDRQTPFPEDSKSRLQTILSSLVDVPIIMQTMPGAIQSAAAESRS